MQLVDSHCHLDRLDLSQRPGGVDEVLAAARARQVKRFLCVGVDLESFAQVRHLAEQHEDVYASVGVHPLHPAQLDEQLLRQYADHHKVVALGEMGLDYYYAKTADEQAAQRQLFAAQLRVAAELAKPVIVHTRDARADTLALLAEAQLPAAGVLHCFTESWEMAEAALALGFYISFSGIISFRNADALRAVVEKVPLDRLLIETDAPYLTPAPHRGRPNEPQYVYEVAEWVAKLQCCSIEQVAMQTSANFNRLFQLD
ncbi:TatD family hydrolase [Balneatrix alpica]|uniref:TatD family hydrolase n=1 Tax=Balneatrix alpica TaxID=75684 RepID=A0ABV5Z919_9GAMM|nr:TatD family hydrolase [Balneatrix alpica]